MALSAERERLTARRQRMVEGWIESRSILDGRVLGALAEIPRELFVSENLLDDAYEDMPLPIGSGQTISQPYIVARMMEALELNGDESALEVGTGSGYAAAVLAKLAREVHTIERIESLARSASERLIALGCTNVQIHIANGVWGWSTAAPYDAIVVAAGAPRLPPPLLEQLAQGGRLVMPIGEEAHQVLVRVRRVEGRFDREDLERVRFVPLIDSGDGYSPATAGC
jgi:protein-L-isoaspartate(D-aspartate) O-methyltransferase